MPGIETDEDPDLGPATGVVVMAVVRANSDDDAGANADGVAPAAVGRLMGSKCPSHRTECDAQAGNRKQRQQKISRMLTLLGKDKI